MSENRFRATSVFVKQNHTGNKEKILQASRKKKIKSHIKEQNGFGLLHSQQWMLERPQYNVFKMLVISNQEFYTQPNSQANKCGIVIAFFDMPTF